MIKKIKQSKKIDVRGKLYKFYSRITARGRMLPTFIVIGVQKGGSTSFYDYITENPLVGKTYKKAPKYFDHAYEKGLLWYKSHFPMKNKALRKDKNLIVGDGSQDTIYHPLAPQRVHRLNPDMKFIVLLRDPVIRAYSHFQHRKRLGLEQLDFESAIEEEENRLNNIEDRIVNEEKNLNLYNFFNYSYIERGKYAIQLKRWFTFFPENQFLIISTSDFFKDPAKTCNDAYKFLNLPEFDQKIYLNSNPGGYSPMKDKTKEKLKNYFIPFNNDLFNMINTDFGWND